MSSAREGSRWNRLVSRRSAVLTISVLAVCVPATSAFAGSISSPPQIGSGDSELSISVGGEVYGVDDIAGFLKRSTTSESSEVTPYLLDPVDSVQCNTLGVAEHEVARVDEAVAYYGTDITFPGGKVHFQCGSLGFGYIHIRNEHEAHWRDKYVSLGFPANSALWDDFMWFVVYNSLEAPETIVQRPANGTLCYTTPVVMMVNDMPTETFYPSVSIAPAEPASTAPARKVPRVITAFPGGACGYY